MQDVRGVCSKPRPHQPSSSVDDANEEASNTRAIQIPYLVATFLSSGVLAVAGGQ